MKKQYMKFLSIELFLLLFSLFHFIFLRQINTNLYLFEIIVIYALLRLLFKIDRKENFQLKEEILVILIICCGYYAVTYILGFFIGFVYTTYSTRFLGILRNVFYSVSFIVLFEFIREILIQKTRYYKSSIIISVIIMTALELLLSLSMTQFTDRKATLEIFILFVIPCLFRNIFLTYSTYYFGKIGSIIYHLLMVTVSYVVPVFPNINEYINIIILIAHPLIGVYLCSSLIAYKSDRIENMRDYAKQMKRNKIITWVIAVILIFMIYLVSDIGRFSAMAIGSGSMTGTINKGDIVVLDKRKQDYKVGDIIAFEMNGSIIVHRIIGISKGEDMYYITKGDANNGVDTWKVYPRLVKGKHIFTVKYLGIPTVALSEYLAGESK